MKSKFSPNANKGFIRFLYTLLLFFNGWFLKSGRHTQPNCKESEERRGETLKQTMHQETKAKLSSVTPNRDKTIHCNANAEKSIPAAMSQRNQHLSHAMLRKPATTIPKQYQTTWCFRKDWQHAGGAGDLLSVIILTNEWGLKGDLKGGLKGRLQRCLKELQGGLEGEA